MSEEMFKKMEKFYYASDLAQQVTKPLKNGAVAEVQFLGYDESYMMIKEKGKSNFRKGKPKKPQIYMRFSEGALDYLLEVQGSDKKAIQEYIARFSECILNPNDVRRVDFKLCTNVLTGTRYGYFGMMLLGGRRAVKLVAQLGIKIPKRFLKDKRAQED